MWRINTGSTAQAPSNVPPQGPLRSPFGRFIGQNYTACDNRHWPHCWQPKIGPFTNLSNNDDIDQTNLCRFGLTLRSCISAVVKA